MDKTYEPTRITPAYLWENGYEYHSPGIQGCDMWQGMGYWTHKETGFTLRGNKGVSYPLKVSGYIDSNIEYINDLLTIFKLLN